MNRIEHYDHGKIRVYNLDNYADVVRYVARVQFALSYELVVVVDSELHCSTCVRENYREMIQEAISPYSHFEFAMTNESELEDCTCEGCGKQLGYTS